MVEICSELGLSKCLEEADCIVIILNEEKIDFGQFPNGETFIATNINLLAMQNNKIILKYENDNDLLRLMFVKKHLDGLNSLSCSLAILYMPYSRQDRTEDNSVFTLKHVCEFINSLHFTTIVVNEPHSDVTIALLNNCMTKYPTVDLLSKVVDEVGFDKEKDYLFYPDAGAQKRYSSKNSGYKEIVGFKKRNFTTGRIESLQIVGSELVNGSKVIIIDDLCSRGGTFILSAERLKEIGATDIYLVVAHCEETILEGDIPSSPHLITQVFTTDSIINPNSDARIKIFQESDL